MMNLTKAKKTFVPQRRLQRAISRYLCIGHSGSLKTTRNNFFTTKCLFIIQLLWRNDDVSLY